MNDSYSLKVTFFLSQVRGIRALIEENLKSNLNFLRRKTKRINPNCFDIELLQGFLFNFQAKGGVLLSKKHHFSTNERSILLLLVSSYEVLFNKSFFNFNNLDWLAIASFFPFMSFYTLKYQFFLWVKLRTPTVWTEKMNNLMLKIISQEKLWPLILSRSGSTNVKWVKISFEMSKNFEEITHFKTNKQCKERWWNHLNPLNDKTAFSLHEDIVLLEKSLLYGTKWTRILGFLEGRNQHQIKNRFILILSQINEISKKTVRQLILKQDMKTLIASSLQILEQRKNDKAEASAEQPFLPEDDYLETISMASPQHTENDSDYFK